MRSLFWAGIFAALLSSQASASEWLQAEIAGKQILRYDGTNFGILFGCDNSETFKITLISDQETFRDFGDADQQFMLVADGKEISRKAAWKNPPVGQMISYDAFLPSQKIDDFIDARGPADFLIGDPISGKSIAFSADISNFKKKSSKLISYCKNLDQ